MKVDWSPIVQRAVERGWIRFSTETPVNSETLLRRVWAEENRARGLTAHGTKRKHSPRTGLSRTEYHRRYMQTWRAKRKQTSTQRKITAEIVKNQ